MGKKAYVIVQGSWEYDDNYYHRNGSGGEPKHVYTKQTLAVAEAQRKNIEAIRGVNLSDYCENGNLLLRGKEDTFRELMGLDPHADLHWDDYKVPRNIDDVTAAKILDCISITFYDVVEVEED